MYSNTQLPVLYAENCPDQPIIPTLKQKRHVGALPAPIYEQQQDKLSRAVRIISKKAVLPAMHNFQPNILKSPKSVNAFSNKKSYQMQQHQRQLSSMKKRISDCKNIQQRKKNHNDPLLYPPYFVRQSLQAKDVRLDGLYNKAIGDNLKNQPHRTFHLPATNHAHDANHNNNNSQSNQNNSHHSNNTKKQKIKHKKNPINQIKSLPKNSSHLKKYHYSLNMSNPMLHNFHNNEQHDHMPVTMKQSRHNKAATNFKQHYNPQQQYDLSDEGGYGGQSDMPTPTFMNMNAKLIAPNTVPKSQKHYKQAGYKDKQKQKQKWEVAKRTMHGTFNYYASDPSSVGVNHNKIRHTANITDSPHSVSKNRQIPSANNVSTTPISHHNSGNHASYHNNDEPTPNMMMVPDNNIQAIITYIYDHCLYKQADLNVLKMRIMHYYGRQQVEHHWQAVIKLLHRHHI